MVLITSSDIVPKFAERGGLVPYGPEWEFVTVRDLAKSRKLAKFDPEKQKLLVLSSLYIKKAAVKDKNASYYNRGGHVGGSLNYEKMMVCVDVMGPAGMNVVVLLLGKGQNPCFFRKHLTARDDGSLSKIIDWICIYDCLCLVCVDLFVCLRVGPGNFFVIENPSPIERWMADGELPILGTLSSAIPVTITKQLPTKPIFEASTRQHAFHLIGAKILLLGFETVDVPCAGNLCSAREMYKNQVLSQGCGCYQIARGDENICGFYQFKIVDRKGFEMWISNFTCKDFVASQTMEGRFSMGVTAAKLNAERRTRTEFRKSVNNQFDYVNERGGFDVWGWVRRGWVKDVSTVDQQPSREPAKLVEAGDVVYHVSYIKPILKESEVQGLEQLKFDVSQFMDKEADEANIDEASDVCGVDA